MVGHSLMLYCGFFLGHILSHALASLSQVMVGYSLTYVVLWFFPWPYFISCFREALVCHILLASLKKRAIQLLLLLLFL
jgi:hypothetical protein